MIELDQSLLACRDTKHQTKNSEHFQSTAKLKGCLHMYLNKPKFTKNLLILSVLLEEDDCLIMEYS